MRRGNEEREEHRACCDVACAVGKQPEARSRSRNPCLRTCAHLVCAPPWKAAVRYLRDSASEGVGVESCVT